MQRHLQIRSNHLNVKPPPRQPRHPWQAQNFRQDHRGKLSDEQEDVFPRKRMIC